LSSCKALVTNVPSGVRFYHFRILNSVIKWKNTLSSLIAGLVNDFNKSSADIIVSKWGLISLDKIKLSNQKLVSQFPNLSVP
jgi:hypothetical protein